MNFTTKKPQRKRTPLTPPEELQSRSGRYFAAARRALNLDRSTINDATDLDYGKILKFEKGGLELNREIWKVYVKGIHQKGLLAEVSLHRASVLLRGLVNEFRLYGRN